MSFKTNLSKNVLISNDIIKVYFDDIIVELKSPTLKIYLNDLDFSEYLFFLKQDPNDFNKTFSQLVGFSAESKYSIFQILNKINYKPELLSSYNRYLFKNAEIIDGKLLFQNKEITNEQFEVLLDMILVSCGEKDLKEFLDKEEEVLKPKRKLSDIEKKILEQEERLKKIKEKKSDPSKTGITIDQIVIGILYEFPGLTLDRVYDMNMFTLLEFWKYVSKVVDTQIQVVAAGNGLIKKFTYFIK